LLCNHAHSSMRRKRDIIISGFSKLLKEEKLKLVAEYFENPGEVVSLLKSFWHSDVDQQKLFDEFSENTITNFYIPYGIAPNVVINGKTYLVPMVIEESSVVAAASAAAKVLERKRWAFIPRFLNKKSRSGTFQLDRRKSCNFYNASFTQKLFETIGQTYYRKHGKTWWRHSGH
jgi:hydroxymethylglutaryl-CoA reductase